MTDSQAIVPRHQWTHDGVEVLILKHVSVDGKNAFNDFLWPRTVGMPVESPNWAPTPDCQSGGLFGWAWGFALGDGKEPDWSAIWLVFGAAPGDVIQLPGGKVKAHRGIIRCVGSWWEATDYLLRGQMAWVHHAARGTASATGGSGAASATGERGAASATGERGAASATGGSGAASATGWRGAASATGESGTASATGWRGAASATGESGAAIVTGLHGRARGGPYGCLALAWRHDAASRQEMRCARIGCGDGSDRALKAGVWYVLNADGDFKEET